MIDMSLYFKGSAKHTDDGLLITLVNISNKPIYIDGVYITILLNIAANNERYRDYEKIEKEIVNSYSFYYNYNAKNKDTTIILECYIKDKFDHSKGVISPLKPIILPF